MRYCSDSAFSALCGQPDCLPRGHNQLDKRHSRSVVNTEIFEGSPVEVHKWAADDDPARMTPTTGRVVSRLTISRIRGDSIVHREFVGLSSFKEVCQIP